ncbi:hypothetical protein C8R44DRAFT_769521 [Mycena epipterygia]|nr:hypothetical protein C8R44DRAFT_769521 [Mycena epipterygia]
MRQILLSSSLRHTADPKLPRGPSTPPRFVLCLTVWQSPGRRRPRPVCNLVSGHDCLPSITEDHSHLACI